MKVVPKKSKQGTYIQSVREHYLRDDIGCQSLACKLCSERDPAEPFLPLSTPVASQTLSATAPHYLIPDAQTLLRFLEIFEAPIITDVIILQTVFAEVDAATNLRTVNRIRFAHHASPFFSLLPSLFDDRALFRDPRRRIVLFCNEHSIYTFVEQQERESKVARTKRGTQKELWFLLLLFFIVLIAIDAAVTWYAKHTEQTNIPIIFLSSEKQDLKEVSKTGYISLSLFISLFWQTNVSVMSIAAYLERHFTLHSELRELCESLQSVAADAPSSEGQRDDGSAPIVRHSQTGYFEVWLAVCFLSLLILESSVFEREFIGRWCKVGSILQGAALCQ